MPFPSVKYVSSESEERCKIEKSAANILLNLNKAESSSCTRLGRNEQDALICSREEDHVHSSSAAAARTKKKRKRSKPGRRTCMYRVEGKVLTEDGGFIAVQNGKVVVQKDERCYSFGGKNGRKIINRASVRCDACNKFFCFPINK
ncbi:predicted protein [Chaetoceros tenuissimus]|uniref:Uncharacterized protein n=1 Tax=Chaetoceros tenuissimus TaxID=426638 RepID=A0AAD3H510_9STRA|nr:predicted protein [Chaetoceros tenuissimus]